MTMVDPTGKHVPESTSHGPAGWLGVKDAAERIGVSVKTLRRWDESGRLKARRHRINGYRMYSAAELDRLLRDTATVAPLAAVDPRNSIARRSCATLWGREREGDRLAELLRSPRTRWVHVSGPIGVGKSRLVFDRLPTAVIAKTGHVRITQLDALMARAGTNVVVVDPLPSAGSTRKRLAAWIAARPRARLVTVARFEVAGAYAHPLRVEGLAAFAPPKGVTGRHRLSPSVEMLLECACISPAELDAHGLALAHVISVQCDGMPVAIEAAAANVRASSLQATAGQLAESDPLVLLGLTPEDTLAGIADSTASMLRTLAVFDRPFSAQDASAVLDQRDVGASMRALEQCGLLVPSVSRSVGISRGRFAAALPSPVRRAARRALEQAPEALRHARARHTALLKHLVAEALGPDLLGPVNNQRRWATERIDRFEEAAKSADPDLALGACCVLAAIYAPGIEPARIASLQQRASNRALEIRADMSRAILLYLDGRTADARRVANEMATAASREGLPLYDAARHFLLGQFAYDSGDRLQALAHCRAAVSVAEAIDHPRVLAGALTLEASIRVGEAPSATLEALYERVIAINEALDDPWNVSHATLALAELWYRAGQRDRATATWERAIAYFASEDPAQAAAAMAAWATVAWASGDLATALRWFRAALDGPSAISHRRLRAVHTAQRAAALAESGAIEAARRCLQQVDLEGHDELVRRIHGACAMLLAWFERSGTGSSAALRSKMRAAARRLAGPIVANYYEGPVVDALRRAAAKPGSASVHLEVSPDASVIRVAGNADVHVVPEGPSHRVIRALMQRHLASPGAGVTAPELCMAAWGTAAPVTRLRRVIADLRERGLTEFLETVRGGYRIRSNARIRGLKTTDRGATPRARGGNAKALRRSRSAGRQSRSPQGQRTRT